MSFGAVTLEDYTAAAKKMFDAAMKKKKTLATNPPENTPNRKLIAKFYEDVIKEVPRSSLYLPEIKPNGNKQTRTTAEANATEATESSTAP